MQDLFTVTSGSVPPSARVMGFHGTEAVSRCYSFEIFISLSRHEGAALDLGDAVGSRIGLTFAPSAASTDSLVRPPYQLNGIVSAIELVNDFGERSVFKITMVPQLWQLGQSMHSRVFTQMTIPAILTAVLEENGIAGDDFELRLSQSYGPEEHVCQYKESDLAFVSRWMEREGMYYFFEHDGTTEKLVITDDKGTAKRLVPFGTRYFPIAAGSDEGAGEALHTVGYRHRALPAKVALADYDYAKPALEVTGSAMVSSTGLGEVSIYGDRFFTPDQGKHFAELRAQALRAGQEVLTGTGTARYLRSGYLFELEEHTRPQLNGEYFVTEVKHVGRQVHGVSELDAVVKSQRDDVYRVTVTAIPASTQFRAERVTPWPRITAFENAIVDGAANSQYAQIDSQGRYAIKFKFDESSLSAGKASTWVRMAQPHGGSVEGFHFPLRKATEVLITFLGGDPDRPLIAAVLPNASTPSPITAGNNTKNVLQTGGATRMEIEDLAGGQYIKHFTPVANTQMWMGTDATSPQGHNVELSTDGSGMHSYGTYFDHFVGGKKTEHVVGDVHKSYDSDYTTKVLGDVVQNYIGDMTRTVTGDVSRTVNGSHTEAIIGPVTQTYQSTLGLAVTGDVSQQFDAKHTLAITGDDTITVTGATTHTYDNGLTVTVNGAISNHNANVSYDLEVKPDATMHATEAFSIRGDVTAKLSAPDTTVHGDTSVTVNGGSTVTIGPKSITVNGSEVIKLSGPTLIEIVGGNITVTGGNISVDAKASMNQSASGVFTISGNQTGIYGGPLVDIAGGIIKLNS